MSPTSYLTAPPRGEPEIIAPVQRAYHSDLSYYEDRAAGLRESALDGTAGALEAFAGAPLTEEEARRAVARAHGLASWDELRQRLPALMEEPFARAYRALEAHDVDGLQALLDAHPELAHEVGTNGNDLLGMAGATHDERLVELLLDRGADIARGNAHGWTPLHQAAYSNLPRLAQLLLDRGAPVTAEARGDGGTPLIAGLFWGHREVPELLARISLAPRNLRVAAGLGDIALIDELHGTPEAAAHRGFYRPHGGFGPRADPGDALDEALSWAARAGRDAAVSKTDRARRAPRRRRLPRHRAHVGGGERPRRDHPGARRPRRRLNARGTFGGPDHGERRHRAPPRRAVRPARSDPGAARARRRPDHQGRPPRRRRARLGRVRRPSRSRRATARAAPVAATRCAARTPPSRC